MQTQTSPLFIKSIGCPRRIITDRVYLKAGDAKAFGFTKMRVRDGNGNADVEMHKDTITWPEGTSIKSQ